MEDPTSNLFLSALAMTDPQLIHHISISVVSDQLACHVKEELYQMLEGSPEYELDRDHTEVYSDEWPEFLALVPTAGCTDRKGRVTSPIISWTPGLGNGKGKDVN